MSEQRNRPDREQQRQHFAKVSPNASFSPSSQYRSAPYRNAATCLPEKLLRQLQQYAGGELLYVPVSAGAKKGWGTCSGRRERLAARNAEMILLYSEGMRTEELAERYELSVERIRRICYGKGLNSND